MLNRTEYYTYIDRRNYVSPINTTTEVRPRARQRAPKMLPGHRSIGCPLLRVCVHSVCLFTSHCCVCALGWVKCRPQIPSMGHHTWPHVASFPLKIEIAILGNWEFSLGADFVVALKGKIISLAKNAHYVIIYWPSCCFSKIFWM